MLEPTPERPFEAPWQAQAFALAVDLNAKGVFTWTEWAAALAATLKAAGAEATGERYYEHWLDTLERLAAEKGAVTAPELTARRLAWEQAARTTPHGQPIELGAG
jgi:nitrile hydratase accessory protein